MALITDATVICGRTEDSALYQDGRRFAWSRPLFIVKSVAESGLKWPAEMRRCGAELARPRRPPWTTCFRPTLGAPLANS
jgi:hypothetical protein